MGMDIINVQWLRLEPIPNPTLCDTTDMAMQAIDGLVTAGDSAAEVAKWLAGREEQKAK